jgi:hypothetical protein
MATLVKVKACADCFHHYAGTHEGNQLSTLRQHEIFEGLDHWREYEFTPGECSEKDLRYDTLCGICRNSLTGDRRHRDEDSGACDRRSTQVRDRRTSSGDRRRHHDHVVALERRASPDADRRMILEDRRHRDEGDVARDRRALPDGDRRTPFNRGSRVLLAALRAG